MPRTRVVSHEETVSHSLLGSVLALAAALLLAGTVAASAEESRADDDVRTEVVAGH